MKTRSIVLGVLLLLAACGPASADREAAATPAERPTTTPRGVAATPVGATPTATSTPLPRIDLDGGGLPVGAIGPLLLYRSVAEDENPFDVSRPSTEVTIWDAGTNTEIGRISIGEPTRQPQESLLAGRYVLVNFGDLLWRYDFGGGREQLLAAPPDHLITGLAVDATGKIVVASMQRDVGEPVALRWIEVASGAVLREVDAVDYGGFGDPEPRVVGAPDEPALLRGVTATERPGGYAILEADGGVRELAVSGFVTASFDGRLLAHGPTAQGCDFVSGSRIELFSVDDGAPLASFEDGALALSPWEWAPDGSEFAVQVRTIGTGNESCDWTTRPAALVRPRGGRVCAGGGVGRRAARRLVRRARDQLFVARTSHTQAPAGGPTV